MPTVAKNKKFGGNTGTENTNADLQYVTLNAIR